MSISRSALGLGAALAGVVVGLLLFSLFARGAGSTGEPPLQPETLSSQEVAERFVAGTPWNGKGKGNSTVDDVREARPDAYWLGAEFGGYHLQAVIRTVYTGPDGRSADVVQFIYGDCVPVSAEFSCPVPLLIRTESACTVRPTGVANTASVGREQLRGGAELVRFNDGHVTFWTGKVMVTVHATGQPALVDRAANAVARLNDGKSQVASALEAGDFSGCPEK